MSDQADKLRQLANDAFPCAEPRGPLPTTIVVTGGKGGVGTTTVALNLSVALSQNGHRTVLLDAAANADAAQLAGIDTSNGPWLDDVLAGNATAIDALHTGPAGMQLLASRWATEATDRSSRTLDRLMNDLHSLDRHADILIIDSGSGMNHATQRFWQAASMVLLVTTADDMAVMDAYATIKASVENAADIRVLVNQCDSAPHADDIHVRMASACQRFLGRTLGRAPRLPLHSLHSYASMTVPRAWEEPSSPFARSVHQLGRFAADVLAQQRWSNTEPDAVMMPTREFSTC